MRNKLLIMATLFAILMLSACSHGRVVINPTFTVASNYSSNIEKSVINAASELGWRTQVVQPGLITATLHLRQHTAVVNITYDAQGYTIAYVDSENLGYNIKKNTIHKNYNRWVQRLSTQISKHIYQGQ